MDSIDETIYINRLLDIYGRLLTNAQYEIMSDYYAANLSLSEISEARHISRTAVSDALKKSTAKLQYFEDKMRICKILDKHSNDANIADIEEELKNGI